MAIGHYIERHYPERDHPEGNYSELDTVSNSNYAMFTWHRKIIA